MISNYVHRDYLTESTSEKKKFSTGVNLSLPERAPLSFVLVGLQHAFHVNSTDTFSGAVTHCMRLVIEFRNIAACCQFECWNMNHRQISRQLGNKSSPNSEENIETLTRYARQSRVAGWVFQTANSFQINWLLPFKGFKCQLAMHDMTRLGQKENRRSREIQIYGDKVTNTENSSDLKRKSVFTVIATRDNGFSTKLSTFAGLHTK